MLGERTDGAGPVLQLHSVLASELDAQAEQAPGLLLVEDVETQLLEDAARALVVGEQALLHLPQAQLAWRVGAVVCICGPRGRCVLRPRGCRFAARGCVVGGPRVPLLHAVVVGEAGGVGGAFSAPDGQADKLGAFEAPPQARFGYTRTDLVVDDGADGFEVGVQLGSALGGEAGSQDRVEDGSVDRGEDGSGDAAQRGGGQDARQEGQGGGEMGQQRVEFGGRAEMLATCA